MIFITEHFTFRTQPFISFNSRPSSSFLQSTYFRNRKRNIYSTRVLLFRRNEQRVCSRSYSRLSELISIKRNVSNSVTTAAAFIRTMDCSDETKLQFTTLLCFLYKRIEMCYVVIGTFLSNKKKKRTKRSFKILTVSP